jgi:hypothetical protein
MDQSPSPEGQERAKFETWCRENGFDPNLWMPNQPQCGYDNGRVMDYWTGWQARASLSAASAPKEPAEPTDGQTERCPDCGVLMEGVFFHFKDCPRSARLLVRANHSGVAAIPQAEKEAGSKCQPDGLMFDAFGNPRVKFARVVFEGSTCVCRLSEAADMAPTGDDADAYEIKEVWLSEQEFAALPEFEGW